MKRPKSNESKYWSNDRFLKMKFMEEMDEYADHLEAKVEKLLLADVSNNAVAVCPKCGATECAYDCDTHQSYCVICQHTWQTDC